MAKEKKEVKALEDFCPFCGKPSGEATIILAPRKLLNGKTKAIGNPCPECDKLLDQGHIGFLSTRGEGVILQKDVALKIMERLGLAQFYNAELRNVVKIKNDKFWQKQFQPIIEKRRKIHAKRKK